MLPNRPTRHWLAANKPSLHRTQGGSNCPARAAAATSGWASKCLAACTALAASDTEVPEAAAKSRTAWREAVAAGPRPAIRAAASAATVAIIFSMAPASLSTWPNWPGATRAASKRWARAAAAPRSSASVWHMGSSWV